MKWAECSQSRCQAAMACAYPNRCNQDSLATPPGLPPIGSVWQEVDPRFERKVEVVAHDRFSGVGIQTVIGDNERGNLTWAQPERFNGKRNGYRRIR